MTSRILFSEQSESIICFSNLLYFLLQLLFILAYMVYAVLSCGSVAWCYVWYIAVYCVCVCIIYVRALTTFYLAHFLF